MDDPIAVDLVELSLAIQQANFTPSDSAKLPPLPMACGLRIFARRGGPD
jgi:hypothetical protein